MILTDTLSNNGSVNHNQTIKVFYGKMRWTGELFLLAGKAYMIRPYPSN